MVIIAIAFVIYGSTRVSITTTHGFGKVLYEPRIILIPPLSIQCYSGITRPTSAISGAVDVTSAATVSGSIPASEKEGIRIGNLLQILRRRSDNMYVSGIQAGNIGRNCAGGGAVGIITNAVGGRLQGHQLIQVHIALIGAGIGAHPAVVVLRRPFAVAVEIEVAQVIIGAAVRIDAVGAVSKMGKFQCGSSCLKMHIIHNVQEVAAVGHRAAVGCAEGPKAGVLSFKGADGGAVLNRHRLAGTLPGCSAIHAQRPGGADRAGNHQILGTGINAIRVQHILVAA